MGWTWKAAWMLTSILAHQLIHPGPSALRSGTNVACTKSTCDISFAPRSLVHNTHFCCPISCSDSQIMAGGLQWRSALSRALKSEEVALRMPLPSQRRAFSSRSHSSTTVFSRGRDRAQLARGSQWHQQSIAAQSFARNRRKFSTTLVSRHNHLDPPKPGEESVCPFPLRSEPIADAQIGAG